MAKLVTEPDVVEFLEYIMIQGRKDVSIEEISCKKLAACFTDKSIKELDIRNVSGAKIIGIKTSENAYIINPSPEIKLTNKDQLFVLGTQPQINKLKDIINLG